MARGELLEVGDGQEQLWYKVEPMEISGRGQNGILVKWQKVFDACLGNQMNSIWNETPQGEMTHIIRAFHQFGAYLGKVANATFVNPRN